MSRLDRLIDWSLDHPLRAATYCIGVWLGICAFLAYLSPWFALGFVPGSGYAVFRLVLQLVRFYIEDREARAYHRGRMDAHGDRIAAAYRNKIRGAA